MEKVGKEKQKKLQMKWMKERTQCDRQNADTIGGMIAVSVVDAGVTKLVFTLQ